NAPRPSAHGILLRGILRHPRPRALRAPDVRRDARRPHPVHQLRWHRKPVGSLKPTAARPATPTPLPPGLLRPAEDARTDRTAPLVASGDLRRLAVRPRGASQPPDP